MKKSLFMGILGLVVTVLSACNTENADMTVPIEKIEQMDVPSDMDIKEEPVAPEDKGDGYSQGYKQVVDQKEGETLSFSLIYLDEDEIPELAVYDSGDGTYSIYTVKNGEAHCMVDAMATVEMDYFEGQGLVSCFARWNGGGDEGGYGWYYYQVSKDKTLTDGDLPVLHFTYDAVYDEEGNWTGGGITKYYYLDQEIDESAYQKRMDEFGIMEGNGQVLIEHGLGKKEMQDLLEQGSQVQAAPDLEGQILDQSFETELDGFGKVVFASFEPINYLSESTGCGSAIFGDVRFNLLSPIDGGKIYGFPGETDDNILEGLIQFKQVLSVAFRDYNDDGRMDILLLLEYEELGGQIFRKARVYTQDEGEREFHIDRSLSEYLGDYTESMGKILEGISGYGEASNSLTEEEKLLNERMEYYRKSAYYEEITDYWENTREVRDVSNRIDPLYQSDAGYLTREMVADDPPVVIHLAKNEIYARHGYIFKDQDLHHYFMGCIWYTPMVAQEDFSDEVFNEYEKENLKLLEELDTL